MHPRRRHLTVLEIPSDHGIVRSVPTFLGHASTAELEPEPEPTPPRQPPPRHAPWTEMVYISPSGRIFLPPDFDFAHGRPRTVTPHAVLRQPPAPEPYRAHVVIAETPRPRTVTRESWVVPPHLRHA